MNGSGTCHWYCLHIGHQRIPQQEFHYSRLMFGRPPKHFCDFLSSHSFDPGTYQAQLEAKLTELRDHVEANVTQAAHSQKDYYDRHSM